MLHWARHDGGESSSSPAFVEAQSHLARFLSILASRARRLGSRDVESAVQETLKRSLLNPAARAAIEFYFSQDHAEGVAPPEWRLEQLFAWLHGVLINVVRDENGRASSWRELPMGRVEADRPDHGRQIDAVDPAPGPLEEMIRREIQGIVAEALPKLAPDYRVVLKMRVNGMKYSEIADRLGVNENTVATWVSRGIRELGQHIRRRTARAHPGDSGNE